MERNIRIIAAKTITKEGQVYLQYTVQSNGDLKTFERPYYGKDGKIDPEVDTILALAKKHADEEVNVFEETEEGFDDYSCEEQENVEEKETLPSYPIRSLTVYTEPHKEAKVNKNYKGMLATGLAGVFAGFFIACAFRACGNVAKSNNPEETYTATTDRNSIVSENTTKLSFLSKAAYTNGVNNLCKYLNEELGFNYQPVDLNSFYYIANMDKITQSTFTELVNECYLPDTDVAIIQSAFNITSDLKTKFGQSGKIDVDFEKIFYDDEMVKVSNDYSEEYNKITTAKIDEKQAVAQAVVDKLEKFMIVEPESGYNTLPVGSEFIFNRIVADIITIKAGEIEVETSQAVMTEINNITDVIKQLGGNFNCLESDQILQNQKTK